jgi:hypothetical protein
MDDTHQPADEYGPPPETEGRHPAELLAELDPADAPEAAEQMADRLAEELEVDSDPARTPPASSEDRPSAAE